MTPPWRDASGRSSADYCHGVDTALRCKVNGMESDRVGYYSTRQAAAKLKCSAKTISRAAKKAGVGIHFIGGRLAALAPADLVAMQPHIHESSGNPEWIAAAKAKPRKRA